MKRTPRCRSRRIRSIWRRRSRTRWTSGNPTWATPCCSASRPTSSSRSIWGSPFRRTTSSDAQDPPELARQNPGAHDRRPDGRDRRPAPHAPGEEHAAGAQIDPQCPVSLSRRPWTRGIEERAGLSTGGSRGPVAARPGSRPRHRGALRGQQFLRADLSDPGCPITRGRTRGRRSSISRRGYGPHANPLSLQAGRSGLQAGLPSLSANRSGPQAGRASLQAEDSSLRAKPLSQKAGPSSLLAELSSLLAEPPSLLAEPSSLLAEPSSPLAEPSSPLAEPSSPLAERPSLLAE